MEGRAGKEGGIDLASKPVPPRPVPRLYLATPLVDDPSPLMASLPGLLAGADVAAVLVRLKPTDQRTMISRVKTLAPAIQDSGAALLLDGHVERAAAAEPRPHHWRRWSRDAARFDGRGRSRRGLRAVRRARCAQAAAC